MPKIPPSSADLKRIPDCRARLAIQVYVLGDLLARAKRSDMHLRSHAGMIGLELRPSLSTQWARYLPSIRSRHVHVVLVRRRARVCSPSQVYRVCLSIVHSPDSPGRRPRGARRVRGKNGYSFTYRSCQAKHPAGGCVGGLEKYFIIGAPPRRWLSYCKRNALPLTSRKSSDHTSPLPNKHCSSPHQNLSLPSQAPFLSQFHFKSQSDPILRPSQIIDLRSTLTQLHLHIMAVKVSSRDPAAVVHNYSQLHSGRNQRLRSYWKNRLPQCVSSSFFGSCVVMSSNS
jgi:hypothetical protein